MTTIQLNKLAMYRAVEALLAHATGANALAAVEVTRAAFEAKLEEIETLAAIQAHPLEATIADRDQTMTAMIDAALTLAGVASTYADQHQLDALATRVRVRDGEFNRARLDQRVRMAEQLYATIAPLVPALAELGVTAAMMDDFQAKIAAATAALPSARGTTVDKKAATAQLIEAFRDVDAILIHRLDPLLLPQRNRDPHFYVRYQATRQVITRRRGRTSAPVEAAAPAVAPTGKPDVIEFEQLAA